VFLSKFPTQRNREFFRCNREFSGRSREIHLAGGAARNSCVFGVDEVLRRHYVGDSRNSTLSGAFGVFSRHDGRCVTLDESQILMHEVPYRWKAGCLLWTLLPPLGADRPRRSALFAVFQPARSMHDLERSIRQCLKQGRICECVQGRLLS